MNSKQGKYTLITLLKRAIPLQIKASPFHNVLSMLICMAQGAAYAISVVITQKLFDAVTSAQSGAVGFAACLAPLVMLACVLFGQQIINGLHHLHYVFLFGKSSGKMNLLLHNKLQYTEASRFEDTDFLDDVNKAKEGTYVMPYFSSIIFMIVFFYGFYLLTIGTYLYRLKPLLLLTIAIAFVPALLAQIVRAKVFTKLEEDSAPLRRECEYYQNTLCGREYFKETRMLGAFKYFHGLFSNTMHLLTHKIWQAKRKTGLLQLALNIATFLGMAVSSYILFLATMSGEITVGAFAAVFSALGMLFQILQEIVSVHIGNMNEDMGKIANFIRVLDIPERIGADGVSDFSKGIVAENISYTYPGRSQPAINNVSLNIANGETVAVVGENGAGKSTLVRLLTGIYCASEGKVTVGGLNIAETSPKSVHAGISGVFQKYQRYKMTLRENVAISDLSVEQDNEKIYKALAEADVELDGVQQDTMLSPEFGGIDLSGGQWQRLAIARGLYRKSGFIVLDEPTSAIDPVEETQIYQHFQRLAKGKCALLVTHRLGSVKIAHRIVVMDSGQIVDIGTHEELLARTGKYADMWAAQAKWYERENQ